VLGGRVNVVGLAVEGEGRVYRFDVEAYVNFSSCNFAKLTAWDNEIGWKACTSLRISGLRPEIKQLR